MAPNVFSVTVSRLLISPWTTGFHILPSCPLSLVAAHPSRAPLVGACHPTNPLPYTLLKRSIFPQNFWALLHHVLVGPVSLSIASPWNQVCLLSGCYFSTLPRLPNGCFEPSAASVCFVSMPLSLALRPPDWCRSDSHLSFQNVPCLESHPPPRWVPPNLNHICRNHLSLCHAAPPPT